MATAKNRLWTLAAAVFVILGITLALTACGDNTVNSVPADNADEVANVETEATTENGMITIAVPSDADSTGRALQLLQDQGLLRLNVAASSTTTANDIAENPNNIQVIAVETEKISATLPDVDYAIIDGETVRNADIDPSTALVMEDSNSKADQVNTYIVAVNQAELATPKIEALVAALKSQTVKDYVANTSHGSLVTVFEGVDSSTIPEAEDDNVIKIGALAAPHAEILTQIQPLLAEKGWELRVQVFPDASMANGALANGELDADFCQSIATLDRYNVDNGTTLQNAAEIYFAPLGLYGGKRSSLTGLIVLN